MWIIANRRKLCSMAHSDSVDDVVVKKLMLQIFGDSKGLPHFAALSMEVYIYCCGNLQVRADDGK